MTAVSSEKRKGEKDRWKESKGEMKMKARGGNERNVSLYIFFLCCRPMSQHQTITLLSKADGSVDPIFSLPCCCDPESALWLDLDAQRENDGSNIKRKHVGDNRRSTILPLSLSCFFLPSFFPEPLRHDTCHELRACTAVTPNAKQLMAWLLLVFW